MLEPIEPVKLTIDDAKRLAPDIKLACFDLDGTIISGTQRISDEDKAAIRRLTEMGVACGVATGRPKFAAQKIEDELGMSGPSLYFSGSLVVGRDRNPLSQFSLYPGVVSEVLKISRQYGIYTELYTPDNFFIERDSHFANIHASYLKRRPQMIEDLESLLNEPIMKVTFMYDKGSLEDMIVSDIATLCRDVAYTYAPAQAHIGVEFCNISHPFATRKTGFDAFLRHLNIRPNQVMAFGDAEADTTFLRSAGIGVAMGNAEQRVKDSAKLVTKTVEESGVAHFIDTLFR